MELILTPAQFSELAESILKAVSPQSRGQYMTSVTLALNPTTTHPNAADVRRLFAALAALGDALSETGFQVKTLIRLMAYDKETAKIEAAGASVIKRLVEEERAKKQDNGQS